MTRQKCLVLGASGLVGQRLQQRLAHHPMFEIAAVAGSSSTAGKSLDSVPWHLEEVRPALPQIIVMDANSADLATRCHELGVTIAFSGLPSDVAITVEKSLTESGIMVFSNASAYRRNSRIPMVIPEINPHHLYKSMHYCATNCTLIPLAIPLSVISKLSNIESVVMRSEQALSGAGWELLNNEAARLGEVTPHIPGEAEKTHAELLHVLGTLDNYTVLPADFDVEISCARISRKNGHQVFVEVVTEQELSRQAVIDALVSLSAYDSLPSAPYSAIQMVDEIEPENHLWSDGKEFLSNPDPSIDLKTGMATVVGNLTIHGKLVCFTAYSHNTIRGAAGGVIFLAELVLKKMAL